MEFVFVMMFLSPVVPGAKLEEIQEDVQMLPQDPALPEVSYQILNADHLLLRNVRQESAGNISQETPNQPFIIAGLSGIPAINVSYGPMSLERAIPLKLIQTGPRVRAFVLARQVRSSSPVIRILFYSTSMVNSMVEGGSGPGEAGYTCVTAHAFWKSKEIKEIRGTCSIRADKGFCLAQLRPEPAWFSPGNPRSSREHRAALRKTTVELYYQTRPSPTSQCAPQESKQTAGAESGPDLMKAGDVTLLRSPPGNPSFMRLRLGGLVIIQTSSRPLKTMDTATFYVFLASTSVVENFILRGLLEVLQLDFDLREQGDPPESRTVTWRLEVPGRTDQDEGTIKIHTVQKDYVGIAPLIREPELVNTAVLTGKKVSVPVRVLGVEADGSVTEITNSTFCTSAHEDTLKVSERCDYVYVNGKESRGRVKTTLNFTYSYLSAQLEVNVWIPRLPLHIHLTDPQLSQIKGWRVPVATGNHKLSRDGDEDEEKRTRGCSVQYQHSPVRVLAAFMADAGDSTPSEHFLGPDWLVDVTRLVRYSLRVVDTSVAQLYRGTVIGGRAPGVTTVQVTSPLSGAVLAERTVRVLDDRVSVVDLGLRLVSGLALSLRLRPGGGRVIVATATTQDAMRSLKQEAAVACWLRFGDGTRAPLDLFDPSTYALAVSSLDKRVASVPGIPGRVVVVAESEGQGALLRAELSVSEACQKYKRRSKLAVGTGYVKVKFVSDERSEVEDLGDVGPTSSPGTREGTRMEIPAVPTESSLQEATRDDKPIRATPGTEKAPANISVKNHGNLIDPSNQDRTKHTTPTTERDLAPGIFTDIEIWIYVLLGVACLGIMVVLVKCTAHNPNSSAKKPSLQCRHPERPAHHWVRLVTPAEQCRAVPVATVTEPEAPGPNERPNPAETPGLQERTATLGRRSATLPPSRSAGPLAKPVRSEPLHSPTSKRNQVQFTTFTTLDIKHLAALKRNWLDFGWHNQVATGHFASQEDPDGQAGIAEQTVERGEVKDDATKVHWPVVKPVARL